MNWFALREFAAAALTLVGATFMLIGAVGLYRMPDLFTRMSASTKAAALGAGSIMLAMGFHFEQFGVRAGSALTIFFLFVTAPVAAHMIGRAGYAARVELWEGTIADEYAGTVERRRRDAESEKPLAPASGSEAGDSSPSDDDDFSEAPTPAGGIPIAPPSPAGDVEMT